MPRKYRSKEEAKLDIINKCKEKKYTLKEPFFYENVQSKFYLLCNICGYDWPSTYNSFIHANKCCKKCAGHVPPTQEEANLEIYNICKEKNFTFKPFIYTNRNTILHLKCENNHEWPVRYNSFTNQKTGCQKCEIVKMTNNNIITHEEALERVLNKCSTINYTLVEPFQYIDTTTRNISIKCNVCGYIKDENSYRSILYEKKGCAKCFGIQMPTQKEAETKVFDRCKEKNYLLLFPFTYKNVNTKLYLKCDNENHKSWPVTYGGFINGKSGCPACGTERAINKIIEKYGEIWLKKVPSYNPNSIIYLDMISEKLNMSIQHALNGGEKKFKRYWVDGYIPEYNICIEWKERHHYSKKNIEKDLKRENYIKNNFGCHIINIDERTLLKDIDNQINIVVNNIKEIILKNISIFVTFII